ncbi:hypothetical protein BpHYR1_020408 [Brachionus plicatilis]|uniref:Uncharacterized protein n=1 Tax=Brachionus plicatilis TaxID=10195 RepID=A0A3M7R711_BRAPC|nr:hypothetical protein BpHYR1_020408 [Brachionus plicatilis]
MISSASMSLTLLGSRVAKKRSFSSHHSSMPSVSFCKRINDSWSLSLWRRSLNMSASSPYRLSRPASLCCT